jgi:hypothetical protein
LASSICYLIDVSGEEFNRLLEPSHRATVAYIRGLERSGEADLWDARLCENSTEFLVDLTGQWTLCKLPYTYTVFLAPDRNPPLFSRIGEWERSLRGLFPHATILRFDDYLLDPWNVESDYLLIRDPERLEKFVAWLSRQDGRYWSTLQTAEANQRDRNSTVQEPTPSFGS